MEGMGSITKIKKLTLKKGRKVKIDIKKAKAMI